jgi:hypothetical protein
MLFSTLLTIFVVPATYVAFETLRTRGRAARGVTVPARAVPDLRPETRTG